MDDIKTNQYSFSYTSEYDDFCTSRFPIQTTAEKTVRCDQDVAWPVVAREFASFMSSVYGYSIAEKLFVQVGSWDDDEPEYVSLFNYE